MELASTLIEKSGYRPKFRELPWNRALQYMKNGLLDMMLSLSRTRERETFIEYIGDSLFEQMAIVVGSSDARISLKTLDDLMIPGYKWGIREKMHYSTEFNQRLENDPIFHSYFDFLTRQSGNYAKILAGRINGLFGTYIGVRYRIKTVPEYRDLVVLKVPFFKPEPVYFGVSRKLDQQIRLALQHNHETLKNKGIFQQIVDKWLMP